MEFHGHANRSLLAAYDEPRGEQGGQRTKRANEVEEKEEIKWKKRNENVLQLPSADGRYPMVREQGDGPR